MRVASTEPKDPAKQDPLELRHRAGRLAPAMHVVQGNCLHDPSSFSLAETSLQLLLPLSDTVPGKLRAVFGRRRAKFGGSRAEWCVDLSVEFVPTSHELGPHLVDSGPHRPMLVGVAPFQ